jgi:hypothetical protein
MQTSSRAVENNPSHWRRVELIMQERMSMMKMRRLAVMLTFKNILDCFSNLSFRPFLTTQDSSCPFSEEFGQIVLQLSLLPLNKVKATHYDQHSWFQAVPTVLAKSD